MVPSLGFGWTIRIIAFLTLLLSLIPVAGMRSRFQPRTVRKLFDKTVLREPDYVLFTFATFFGYLGLYIPYFYIQLYSESNSLITDDLNFYLLAVMNAAGFFGRIVSLVFLIMDLVLTRFPGHWRLSRLYWTYQRLHT